MRSIFGECSGNVRSTPTPKDCLRTVKALALDHDALEHLCAPAGALDDLEVDADAITGLEGGDAPELRTLETVDDGAHGEERPPENGPCGGASG
jgi:hypothetical protein